MRVEDTHGSSRHGSGAVSPLIGTDLRRGDVDSTNERSTPRTTTLPGTRISTTATRTTTTRTTTTGLAPSANEFDAGHAEFSFEDLVVAYLDCRKNKRNTHTAVAFEQDLERNLARLYGDLADGSYLPGPSICFIITRPKAREVWAADFRDRIVHHLLYNRVAPRFYARFIADTCACIPGRGTLYAAQRLEAKIRSITQNWTRPAFYLKCDLANFFVSIDKRVVREQLAARITEPWWMALADTVLFHDPRVGASIQSTPTLMARVPAHKRLTNQADHCGLPIGNLSSQFFANVYLDALDQHCKHQVRARHYIRYVDDFILLHESPQWLNSAHDDIEAFLPRELGVRLNPSKTVLQPVDRGVDFVGHVIKPHSRTVRRRSVRVALERVGRMAGEDLYRSANSYFGLLRQSPQSHTDRARLANVLRSRGLTIDKHFTKTYRTKEVSHER